MFKSLKITLILTLFFIQNLNSNNLNKEDRFIVTTTIIALLIHKALLHGIESACIYIAEKPIKDLIKEKIVTPVMQHIKINHKPNK